MRSLHNTMLRLTEPRSGKAPPVPCAQRLRLIGARVGLCGLLAVVAPLCASWSAEPLLERVDVFEAGKEGYAFYRIPGLVVTSKGTVLAYCEARRASSDWSAIDIMIRRSADGGKTWAPRQKIGDIPGPKRRNPVVLGTKLGNPDDLTYNNPVGISDGDGTVYFLFCLEYMRCFYQRSQDDGQTWSKPREITGALEGFRARYDWKVLATGPGHGIQLRNGRLLVPVWVSPATGGGAHRPWPRLGGQGEGGRGHRLLPHGHRPRHRERQGSHQPRPGPE